MKKRLGISIYPEIAGKEETLEYIKNAHGCGFERIFANLLDFHDTVEGRKKLDDLKQCLIFSKELGMEVIVDVSPHAYQMLKLKPTEFNFFYNLGATGVRLDEDFNGDIEAELSKSIIVELNASTGIETMQKTLAKGGKAENLIACHNFYPMRWTGLKYERFLELSQWYYKKGIKVAAFITLPESQKGIGPWNVNDGMPTIEEHRDASLSEQIRHHLATDLISDIIISQQGTTIEQFKIIKTILDSETDKLTIEDKEKYRIDDKAFKDISENYKVKRDLIFELEEASDITEIEKDIIYKFPHVPRADINSYFMRSSWPRVVFDKSEIKPRKHNSKMFKPGDVVVLNKKYNRYMGELHIITKEIPNDGKRNYVGHINKFDHLLFDFASPTRNFKLIKTIKWNKK
ncbi:MupG family TIM beta-alpha barrel fold protein [Mycoplasma todarodis]|uniref:DUF871 domain-containing protein n=1 Tax=Mycoplasma todarodis TaxID=1937191 RepID=A0A4R0XQZ1_9MOLU|nr:MupG family TIM beta-alpha barrel fold protein [Mycoplasma todarodis]TCG11305.1 hypothetical protein C4B25_01825 [Mycoplasma todarodis]